MDMKTLRRQARERMNGVCRVCPVCDGRVCAGELPGMGGIRTGAAFRANVGALEKIRFNMRVIHEIRDPQMASILLGKPLRMPVLIAPMAGAKFNMGGGLTEDEYARAVTVGAKAAGSIVCTGDGTSEAFEAGLKAVAAADSWGIPVIKPWAEDVFYDRLNRVANAGCTVVGMDIDTAAFTALARSKRPVSPKSPAELRAITDKAHALGMKFILKGVMSTEDAQLAKECGCDALVVSNHGGRVFEALPGTAEVLPAIAKSVQGIKILVDGGVRSGADVLKMLALGAHAVLIGRPAIIAAMGGGEEGVQFWLERIQRQLHESMLLTGCADIREAGPHLLASTLS